MKTRFDVIIIGAGPTGSVAAMAAARNGVSVLLLEEHEHIGIPVVCAEGLSRSTIQDVLTIQPEWIAQPLHGAIIRGPRGHEFKIEYPHCGWILDRTAFDPALAGMAQQHGVILKTCAKAIGIEGDTVVVQEKNGTRKYHFVQLIGADGIRSQVGQWMGMNTRLDLHELTVCAEYSIEDIECDHLYATFIFGEEHAPGGYAWIFPKSRNSANVGLGIAPHITKKSAKSYLDKWITREFPRGRITRKVFGGTSAKVMKHFSGKNFLIAGDAARLTDPLSGAGIASGIKSGIFAGESAAARILGKRETYDKAIRKHILPEIRYHCRVRNGYIKLSDREYEMIYDICQTIFRDRTVTNISIRHIVTRIVLTSPTILRLAFSLIF